MNTEENKQGLRKIIDMTSLISIFFLAMHFYYYCYGAFVKWELTATLTNSLLRNITNKYWNTQQYCAITKSFFRLNILRMDGINIRGFSLDDPGRSRRGLLLLYYKLPFWVHCQLPTIT